LLRTEQRRAALALLEAMPSAATFSAPELATAFYLPAEMLRKRLDHFRASRDNWCEVRDAKKNEPRILHRIGAIAPLLREILTTPEYQGKTAVDPLKAPYGSYAWP
jgi:hypothetical protein